MSDNKNNESEKTRIVNSENTNSHASGGKTKITNDQSNTKKPVESLKETENKKSQGISKGGFAAGVGAAGVGGVAAGTAFSDDIRGVFGGSDSDDNESENPVDSADTTDVSEADVDDVTMASVVNEVTDEDLVEAEEITPDDVSMEVAYDESVIEAEYIEMEADMDVPNEMHIEVSDSDGFYEVTITDFDGDNQIDSMTVEAELVDGSHVSFSASGTVLDALMESDGFELANTSDYLEQAHLDTFDGYGGESIGAGEYHIQSGDTLSEIAEAHGTSVAHIMDLNPSITDPNVIYSGDDILIPENDVVSGPYDGWRPEWSDSYENSDSTANVESESYESEDHVNVEEYEADSHEDGTSDYSEPDSEFESMNWESFEDQPMEDYSAYFDQEDFASYDAPDAYYYSGDIGGGDFV